MNDAGIIEWAVSPGLVAYEPAAAAMEARAAAIAEGRARELVWLLEHPPLYTAGVSAKESDLLEPARLPIFRTGRGGQFTYHGPGQRVVYLMLDLRTRGRDVKRYIGDLERWLIAALAGFGVEGLIRPDRVGVWVARTAMTDDKIAAIGVRVRRWVTFHGIALNVAPDLSHYDGIVPCGVTAHGVTSLAALGVNASMADVDAALKQAFEAVFGAVAAAPAPLR
ncbi:MAG: lipoyl(octanoyl) transferase LipB [Hyphomonadaceae bacterium]|nr:lipoyl(octanoyl) transferase LipB [Hyphomonadaceae bacterium]